MPIYEFECKKCRCHFDLLRSFSEDGEATCPECQGKARRILTPVPIIFKGPGFYVTDKAAEDEKRSGKRKESDTTASTESVPAPKKEKKKEVGT